MSHISRSIALCMLLVASAAASGRVRRMPGVHVEDAFARSSARGEVWTVGTGTVEMALDCRGGRFVVSSLRNMTANQAVEYAPRGGRLSPLAAGLDVYSDRYNVTPVWQWFLPPDQTHDVSAERLRIAVKAGDMIGFAVGPHGDYTGDQIDWPITVDYGDGTVFRSADEKKVEPGTVWGYYVNVPGTGSLVPMDAVELSTNTGQSIRIPSEMSGFRAPGMAPHIGPSVMHPSNEYDAVRVWRAPKAGIVTVSGLAKHIGYGAVDLKVLRISEKRAGAPNSDVAWRLGKGMARSVVTGGRPAVQVDLRFRHAGALVHYHVLAFPETSILRQWAEVENPGRAPISLRPFANALALQVSGAASSKTDVHWMVGGNSQRDQGKMITEAIDPTYHRELSGTATIGLVPWVGVLRQSGARDGWFAQLDFIGQWRIALDRSDGGPIRVQGRLPELLTRTLDPGERASLPVVTFGVFRGDLDDMSRRVYDWQYEYLWDYTHDDWFGLMQFTTAWWADSHNLQEQFAGRLGYLDMDWTEYMRECGLDVLWDDAGWAANPDIWVGNREGPDFAETVRYVAKTGMKWALWFPGDPTIGIMDGKVGAWGNFQWRTDGLGLSYDFDRSFRQEVSTFLRRHPRSSWQTCSGGSTYSHTFDIQRLGDVHYDTDGPGSDITNNNFSYLELPDKTFDNLATWQPGVGVAYIPDMSRRMLTGSPKWGLYIKPQDMEPLRKLTDLYRYLWREGVVGRWSYVAHPAVKGDDGDHYLQRVSRDRKRSLLILKHRATGEVTVFPRGLNADTRYLVEFESGRAAMTESGAVLMAKGIAIRDQVPGETIYLNLPHRPGSGRDKTPPKAPGRVLSRRELNLGHTGVALYWSPGADNDWISYYEVRRSDKVLGKTATGLFYFDRSEGWDPAAEYAVRTVDGDGNRSPWTRAQAIPDQPLAFSALGAHYPQPGRNGWRAESSVDGEHFAPMTWVPPARPPSADLGGTPNQRGGAEGYWESPEGARVGRGWQLGSGKSVCARGWVAPKAGAVRITGRAMKEYYHRDQGGPLGVRVTLDGRQLWPQIGWEPVLTGDLTGRSHDLIAQVAAGDVIRFELDRGASPEHDLLVWMPRIAYVEPAPHTASGTVVRILCGSREPYVDRAGNTWSADRLFSGGKRVTRLEAVADALPTLADQELYRRGRVGPAFTYTIPVKPGLYALRLKFAETHFQWFFQRPFSVSVNGRVALRNIDICQSARGPRRAHERVLRYVVPDAAGNIVLRFTAGHEPGQQAAAAIVQAIEVLPETDAHQRVAFAPGRDLVDWAGTRWSRYRAPQSFLALMSSKPVTQATPTLYDQQLYRSARTGERLNWSCQMPAGLYTVRLKFAELWLDQPGKRPMNIWINGKRLWHNWDPLAAAGKPGMAIDLRAEDVTPDHNGRITVTIIATGANPAIVQAIELE